MIESAKLLIANPRTGTLLRNLSGCLFAAVSICVKAVSAEIPVGQIVFFRSAFALLPLVIFLWLRAEFPRGLATRRPLGHLLRSSLGAAAIIASFASIARLPLARRRSSLTCRLRLGASLAFFSCHKGSRSGGSVAWCSAWRECPIWCCRSLATSKGMPVACGDIYRRALMGTLTAFALIIVRNLSRTETRGAIAFYFVIASMIGGIATVPFGWAMTEMLPSASSYWRTFLVGLRMSQ